LREDLPELIAHAEANNQVTGILSDGLVLENKEYLETLLQTGLDHLTIILHPESETIWKVLDHAIPEDLFVAVHITITEENQTKVPALIQRLADLGVHTVSLSASGPDLGPALETARDLIAELDFNLVWNLPVPYSALRCIPVC